MDASSITININIGNKDEIKRDLVEIISLFERLNNLIDKINNKNLQGGPQ